MKTVYSPHGLALGQGQAASFDYQFLKMNRIARKWPRQKRAVFLICGMLLAFWGMGWQLCAGAPTSPFLVSGSGCGLTSLRRAGDASGLELFRSNGVLEVLKLRGRSGDEPWREVMRGDG